VLDYRAAMSTIIIWHPLHQLDMVKTDYFLLPRLKAVLAVTSVMQESFKETWDGVARTIAKEDFRTAFRRWKERYEKCRSIGGGFAEK
jgi:hypothetical protein